jgi:hypothetical protein
MSVSGAAGTQQPIANQMLPQMPDAQEVNPELALIMSLFQPSAGTTFNPAGTPYLHCMRSSLGFAPHAFAC